MKNPIKESIRKLKESFITFWIDKQVFLKKVLIASLILTLALICLYLWNTQTKEDSAFVTMHCNPKISGSIYRDSWAAMIGSEEFSNLSNNQKLLIADKYFNKAWKFANNYGYNKNDLKNWFYNTAKNHIQYPILEFQHSYGGKIYYRDLQNSNPPESNRLVALQRVLFQLVKELDCSSIFFLIMIFFLVFVGVFIIGGFFMILTSNISLIIKLSLVVLITIIIYLITLLDRTSKYPNVIPASLFAVNYSDGYGVLSDMVTATGTWRGVNQKIAYPINVVEINCIKDEMRCEEIDANIADKSLFIDTTDWTITSWGDYEIIIDHDSKCNTLKMIINFRDKAVTQIRAPKDPRPDDCMTGNDGKFITELVDGIELLD